MSYVVLSLYRRFKRTLADSAQSSTADEEAYDNQEVYDEPSFEYEEPAAPSNPYFSYEYEAAKPVNDKTPKYQPVAEPQPLVDAVPQMNRFDLRQAVIYQTVLNNHYIDEINQINQ